MKKVKNFARFFVAFNRIPYADKELREDYVREFTGGRESSLTGMFQDEYDRLCQALEKKVGIGDFTTELKRQRSAVLKRISKLGIDTGNWEAVDNFCLNPRIAGKLFRQLHIDELRKLVPKLEAIIRKNATRTKRTSYRIIDDMDASDTINGNTKSKAIELYLRDIDGLIRRAANQLPS